MSELRMYVEHLFEGRTLTSEMIELKEEIYGNLIARYEDYRASGMSDAEALAKTKASITSVDDLVEDERAASADAAATTVMGAGAQTGAPAAPAAHVSAAQQAPAQTTSQPCAPAGAGQPPQAPGAPVPPGGTVGSEGAVPHGSGKRPAWQKVAIAAGAVIGVCLVAVLLWNMLVEPVVDAAEDTAEVTVASQLATGDGGASGTGTGTGAGQGSTGNGARNGAANAAGAGAGQGLEIWRDDSGMLWCGDDPADDLLEAVVADSYADVAPYAGTALSDSTQVEAFVRSLPMGDWVGSVDASRGGGELGVRYTAVPHHYEDDSIDAALVYNATAIMCAMPDVSSVSIELNESDDHEREFDHYVFDRSVVEGCYGVSLTSDLINEGGWSQIKTDNMYRRNFIDNMCERAERG